MANFHRGQNNALKELVAESRFEESGYFGPWESAAMKAFQNQICKAPPWNEYLTELDILSIFFSRLYRFKSRIPENFVGLLRECPDEKLLPDIENDLRSFFESIPRAYFIYFPLSQWPSFGIAEIQLGDGIFLVDTSITDNSQKEKIKRGLLDVTLGDVDNRFSGLDSGIRYLKLSASGYCYPSIESSPVAEAMADLKQFLFFGVTSELFHTRVHPLSSLPFSLHKSDRSAYVRHQNLSKDEDFLIKLPVEIADYLYRLRIDESHLKVWQSKGQTMLDGEFVMAKTSLEKTEAISSSLGNACDFINLPKRDPDVDRVRTAMQWFMDAETTQNQAISFLQRCIGLEALFGANDESRERGITDRLSDRYSYLIGKTQSERIKLKKDFTEIYSKRSDIVHSRVARLNTIDFKASLKAETMLQLSCLREISTLLKLKRSK